MFKEALLVAVIVVVAIVLIAGAIFFRYYQRARYEEALEEKAELFKRQRLLEEKQDSSETGDIDGNGNIIRIKLLNDDSEKIVLMADERKFGSVVNKSGEEMPDYAALHDYLSKRKSELESKLEPKPDSKKIKVLIDTARGVDSKHVIFTLKECVRAGIDDISFQAAPTLLDEEMDSFEQYEESPKQK